MKRYFIVFYTGSSLRDGSQTIGFTDFSTDGSYLNMHITNNQLMESQKLGLVVVTNIIELTESDYKDWGKQNT